MFIVAQDGDMGYWNADDVVKAKRSIKRLNPTCDIFDRRDYIIKYEDRQKSNYYNKILSDLTLNKTEIAAPEAIQVVQRLDQTISKLEKQAENMFADRANSNDIKELYEKYSNIVDKINDLRKIRYQDTNIVFKNILLRHFNLYLNSMIKNRATCLRCELMKFKYLPSLITVAGCKRSRLNL